MKNFFFFLIKKSKEILLSTAVYQIRDGTAIVTVCAYLEGLFKAVLLPFS